MSLIVILGAAVVGLFVILTVLLLVQRKLREKYAVLWVGVGVLTILTLAWPNLLIQLTAFVGVELPVNLLFGIAILLLLGVTFHLSWELSRLEERMRRLAEETAIQRAELDALTKSLTHTTDEPPGENSRDGA